MSLGKLLALPELHFPHRSSEGLGQGKRVHLDEPCCVLSPGFPPPKSPGCQDDWHTLMSPEAQILVPDLPCPGLTSAITRQNSHAPHHVHRSSRACCGPHCWLLQAIMPPYSAALPPATPHTPPLPEQIGSSLYVCPTLSFHPNPVRALLYPLSFPLIPLMNPYSSFKAQNSSPGEAHSRQTSCSVNTVPE